MDSSRRHKSTESGFITDSPNCYRNVKLLLVGYPTNGELKKVLKGNYKSINIDGKTRILKSDKHFLTHDQYSQVSHTHAVACVYDSDGYGRLYDPKNRTFKPMTSFELTLCLRTVVWVFRVELKKESGRQLRVCEACGIEFDCETRPRTRRYHTHSFWKRGYCPVSRKRRSKFIKTRKRKL